MKNKLKQLNSRIQALESVPVDDIQKENRLLSEENEKLEDQILATNKNYEQKIEELNHLKYAFPTDKRANTMFVRRS